MVTGMMTASKLLLCIPRARSLLRLHRLDFAIAWRTRGLKRRQQPARCLRHIIDGSIERGLVGLRGLREAAQLAHELECRGMNLVLGRRRLEVEQRANVASHRTGSITFPSNVSQSALDASSD